MNTTHLSLIAATMYLSCVSVDAQVNLVETHAPEARMALAEAPPLPLEKVAVAIQAPANWQIGRISAVALGRDGVAFVLQRGDKADPVIVVDRTGRVLRSWGKGMFKIPHSIKTDPDGNVWTTDAGDGLVMKFTSEGKKLQEIALGDAPVGKDCGFPSAAVNNFIDACGTTDITFLPGGRLLLTDGYGKMRVLEYAADGTRIREWGGRGDRSGQFRVPHGLAYDGRSVLYVADRDNGRLQRFDLNGRYLGEWSHLGRVGAIAFHKGVLWAATGVRPLESSQTPGASSSWVIKVDPSTGKILGKIETSNADFIDVAENGEIVAGAAGTSFTRYRQTQAPSLLANALADWTSQKDVLMKLARAMPEEKFVFKPTPPQRNYGEQILHIAEANVNQMGRLAARVSPPAINMKATSKAEILKALEESFDYGIDVLKGQTDETMLQAAETTRFDRFMGPSTRARVVSYVMGHTWDIYGQMVVYVRLNGITPPASQRP